MAGPVLIIEDDPDIAECLRYGLESAQLEARVALTGEEGLLASLDTERPPRLILLDILLPGMSGVEICRRLRRESLTRTIPIILMSAKGSPEDIARLEVGANDYIGKPFSIKEVVRRIDSLLSSAEIS